MAKERDATMTSHLSHSIKTELKKSYNIEVHHHVVATCTMYESVSRIAGVESFTTCHRGLRSCQRPADRCQVNN
ncbi:hypothetical protein SERLA73DRAFT_139504 [Serpula lacrymans var. lacrymans S7.3]|uniref:Uncharacterized protein n=2 Tax=Serpula lacrymans var. lacrymans TaxID=341189 RepID=F8Q2C3_SERL3|nr:uncharacterized protein SERLADRAFT_393698 [Serpula lacrymans var. lacrymans S7.9]EGN97334.1 hypothetical protein SERLA73DRAFT_139504 [Serpula lacrymans var. lacrymans S7.3]EGO22923.1 hypothetical protein SERLADRAFT_393698 [Serpula lacrymans var. lacrymans S7.9]